MAVTSENFGKNSKGEDCCLYTITNGTGMTVRLTDQGASLVSILLPDRSGQIRDVILGYDSAEEYSVNGGCLGAILGRNANRIADARFSLNGRTYQLERNKNENNIHSGPDGFHKRLWKVENLTESSIEFRMNDADLQQGYPGNFTVGVTYSLKDDGTLEIHYNGSCDQDTVANMTNHVYFNLGGHDSGNVLHTRMQIDARYYTPVADSGSIPTGEIAPVEGTPMDFRSGKEIGADIGADFSQLQFSGGYDHNYVLNHEKGGLERFAKAYEPSTGICLEAFTDLPGVQFYTANSWKNGLKGKNGAVYYGHQGFCLETQYYPNSINQEGFPHPVLRAGDTYETITCYRFSLRQEEKGEED